MLMTLLPSPAFDTYNARILEIAAADAVVFPITTSDLPLQDDLNHWTYIGQRVIGARMVDKIQYGTGSAITDYFEAQNLAFMTNTPVQVAAGVATTGLLIASLLGAVMAAEIEPAAVL